MTLVQLRHFIELARAGSFVRASDVLCMTQPALSRSIKALEEELGRLLFDRIGKRIELTAFGQEVLARSQALVEEAEQLRHCGRALSPEDSGRIRVGLSSGPGALLSAVILSHFTQHYPKFHVDIVRSNTASLAQMLRDRLLDALVVDIRSLRPAPDLRVTDIAELDGVFMCRPGHPLARLARVSFAQLNAYPVCSTPLSEETARILVERYGEQAHPAVLVKLASDEISHLVQVTQDTDAVLLAIRASAPHLVELPLSPPLKTQARFGLVTIASKSEPPFLPVIRGLMREALHDGPAAAPAPR
ncbi:MAG: LysR family transcriptional regulator [Pseudacidovorax sp.]|uniref:LysR substrate-binding domain-containing protein n=1 Tax=Pseudacidovorax sp. TaxID=1934311 RepID=UPI001B407948|nr:LysR family transcriptional regulator [Pseudacidovorax sp.]MBP6893540.1 LysR family transcriptional regulator [Pseudacidovorax sp.]